MPKFCVAPFYMLDIKPDGSCWICCEQWLPKILGNINENTLDEIWNGETARSIRSSILDGSFRYCSKVQCPALSSDNLDHITEFNEEERIMILDRNVPRDSKIQVTSPYSDQPITDYIRNKFPGQINLSYDHSCNLQCPSCRTKVTMVNQGPEFDRIKKIHDNVIQTLFHEPHDHAITINVTGSGDPFASSVYRDFLFNFDPSPWPNVKLGIQTHGGLLTPITWARISQWHKKIEYIKICFDAATKETYKIVRKGGNWDQLMLNCEFLNDQMEYNDFFGIADFVVQDHNFKEMPAFAELFLNKFPNFRYICFYVVNNWGTWSNDEYEKRAIWKDSHPQYQELLEVLKHPVFKNKKVILGSFDSMITG